MNYFFDTYAIIEIIKQNPNYRIYINEEATITIFNLAEIYWSVLNDFGEEKADIVFTGYKTAFILSPVIKCASNSGFRTVICLPILLAIIFA